MGDLVEAAQELACRLAEDAVLEHAQRPRLVGRNTCANLDCREPITPQRTALGAQLCLECQRADEAAAVHFRTWRGPR